MFAQAVAEEEVDDFAEAFGKGKALKARKEEKQDKAKVYNPKVLKQEVAECAATLVRWITEAETQQKASAPDPLSFSMDEVKEFVKGAKLICARLQAA